MGKAAEKPEPVTDSLGWRSGTAPEEGVELAVLQTRHLMARKWGCRAAALQTGLYGRAVQETYFHCQVAGSGGSGCRHSACPSQTAPEEAEGPAAAAAAAAAFCVV